MTLLLVYLAIAIGVSFICSILEAVLLSMTPSFTENIKADKPRTGRVVIQVKEQLDESISSILILNTFAHTMGAAGVGSQAVQIFGAKWETLIAILLTLAILYLSEIIPKTIGAVFWRSLAIPAAYLILWLVKLVYPLVWVSTRLTRLFSRSHKTKITREEILAMAALGKQGGALIAQENEYLANLFRLREITIEQILTPRTVVHTLDQTLTVSAALDNPRTLQFSRIPVYGKDIDDITGKVLRTHLFAAERNGQGSEPITNLAQSILRVAEKMPVQELLDQMIKHHLHLCLVEDEFGQTAGIVTLEDAIETLLGREIIDESDTVEDMQQLARDKYQQRLRESDSHPAASSSRQDL